jgi:hypothetical protein
MEEVTWSQGIIAMLTLLVTLGLGVLVTSLFYNKMLRPLLRAFSARRRKAKQVFYRNKYPLYSSVLNNHFEDFGGCADRVAVTILFCLYRSWLYRGFMTLLSDVQNNAVDFTSNILGKQVVDTEKRTRNENKKDCIGEKTGKIVCEYAKTCEDRYSCILATPSRYSGENRSGCTHLNKMIELVEYNPSAGVHYVRCAAALVGRCMHISCEHFGPHEHKESCRFPHIKYECKVRIDKDTDTLHRLDRKNLLHCVVSDASVDLNMSFKRKKKDD